MSVRRRNLLMAMIFVVVLHGGMAVGQEVLPAPAVRIAPDGDWQRLLQSTVDAKDANAFDEQLIRLRRLAERDDPSLFSQLLHFHDQIDRPPAQRDALVGRILKGLNLPRHAAILAIVPHLDNEVASIRATTARLLAHYEDASPEREADFSPYRDIIEQNVRAGRPTSEALIRHLFATDASLALRTLVRAFQLRDLDEIRAILKSERAVANWSWKRRYGIAVEPSDETAAVRAVEDGAAHTRWWVRLYAIKTLAAHAELASPVATSRLEADPHSLVAEAYAAYQAGAAKTPKAD